MRCDVVIFGGGIAGLWLLDESVRRGHSAVLLEARALGHGQTVASQGIIHGGLKYTLQGLLTRSASNIREMPQAWRECLEGSRSPDLRQTRLRAEHCYLWRSETIASRVGMIGARIGLHVAPESLPIDDRPDPLKRCPGTVARLNEQVIDPQSLIADFRRQHASRIARIDPHGGVRFDLDGSGIVRQIRLRHPDERSELILEPGAVALTAGSGNAELRGRLDLPGHKMQRRPLHMVLARGRLPHLNGHCVDGSKTRVTITSDVASNGETVWQIGGQISEDGVSMEPSALVAQAEAEIRAVLPGLDLSNVEWATYHVDRAELATTGGRRPDSFGLLHEGNVITAWPTKLVLAPLLAEKIVRRLPPLGTGNALDALPADWPKPDVARPPWETRTRWFRLAQGVAA